MHSKADPMLIRRAMEDSGAREELRELLLPRVSSTVKVFLDKHHMPHTRQLELTNIGMSAFDYALSVYMKNPENFSRDTDFFCDYYIWWARQAIVADLDGKAGEDPSI